MTNASLVERALQIGDQATALFREGVSRVANCLAVSPLRYSRALGWVLDSWVSLLRGLALLAGGASAVAIACSGALAHRAAGAGPRLKEGVVHTEVLVRQPALVIGGLHDVVAQLDDGLARNESFAVLVNTLRTQTASSTARLMN